MAARSTLYEIFALCVILLMYTMVLEVEAAQEKFEKSLPSDGISLVVLKAANGSVRLSGWERQEVSVKATKKVSADTDQESKEYLDKIEIRMEKVEDRIEIEAGQVDITLNYEIFTPENLDLNITTGNGPVYVADTRGRTEISTGNGSIELRNVAGSVSAESGNGDIFAEILFDAESTFSTNAGSIDIRVGDDFSVPVSAHTLSGSINVVIPEGYPADVEASAQSGTVTCEIPFDGSIEGGVMRGKLSGGGPLLKLNTVNGNITITGTMNAPAEDMEETAAPTSTPEELPVAEAIETSTPPIIDGKLDDECWKNAGRIGDFVSADGTNAAREPTVGYLLWDDQNLYIGIKCYESHMEDITFTETDPGQGIWKDDNIQIFIDPAPDDEGRYYHITINPTGAVLDQEVGDDYAATHGRVTSSAGVGWNSGGSFDTDIRSDFWSIEASLPISAMGAEPQVGGVWGFNLYRMEQYGKEHTYWSPPYDLEDWPHVPSRFGELVLSVGQPAEEQPAPPEEALTISQITVEGNEEISEEEILGALELAPGDVPDVDTLSRAKNRLRALGWFRNVDMELIESDGGLHLIVRVTEKNIISPSEVKIRGGREFPEQQLVDYFSLTAGKITMQDVNVKCKLIKKLYESRGYTMAIITSSVEDDTLFIDINEGIIDKIIVIGNSRIKTEDITDALDVKTGVPFNQREMEDAIRTVQDRLPYFRSIRWEVEQTIDGLIVVYIYVEEELGFKVSSKGTGEFNRVHGLQWGLAAEVESMYWGLKGNSEILYGFSSKIWNYRFAAEKSWFRNHRTSVGIDVHRITDTNDRELVSDLEHFIAEAILGEAWRDFYQRKGYELSFGQVFTPTNSFGLKYRNDKYTSLAKHNDWSLLNRSYADEDWSEDFRWTGGRKVYTRADQRKDEDEKYKPDNPPIKEGNINSLIAEYTIDTRNSEKSPTNGWLNTFSAEHAGGWLSGDSDFNLYKVNIRRYNRLGGNQFFNFRIKAARTDSALPALHPRKFYLGGIGTLRGHRFKEFEGDKMVLINAEYLVTTGWPPGLGLIFFLDSGYAWHYMTDMKMDDMKTDVGIGFQLGGLQVNLAWPIEEENTETILSVRLARMF